MAVSNAATYYAGEGLHAREAAPYAYEEGLNAYFETRDAEPEAYLEDDLYER